MGSLLTALASWLDARAARGRWLLRIDDLDRTRCTLAAESEILRQLEAHGLTWDETPRRQSARVAEYEDAIARLRDSGALYACTCTRARLALTSLRGTDGPVYAGTCRETAATPSAASALRFRMPDGETAFDDRVQGGLRRDNRLDIGDFVVQRNDGICGYQLACAVDEHAQRITRVVRGADLIPSTLCQLHLLRALGYDAPSYAHIPVIIDRSGRKLSKQNHARPLDLRKAAGNLVECLSMLGQTLPPSLARGRTEEIMEWAVKNWALDTIPRQTSIDTDVNTNTVSRV
jgi:glutamyl-Q tRNA(Asp) synthetase